MDLLDLLEGASLSQDNFSQSGELFGPDNQLSLIGKGGKIGSGYNSYYIVKCSVCSKDGELFGEGYFRSSKKHLVSRSLPCGCAKNVRWSQDQYATLCSRKAEQLGYKFLGFEGEWKAANTKLILLCENHGEWNTGVITSLIHGGSGCPVCKIETISRFSLKPDGVMIRSFLASESFHPDTKFWRSERKDSKDCKAYWYVYCPECSQLGESAASNLQKGKRPCACTRQRQQECYINFVMDNSLVVAIKFGIARDSISRSNHQNRKSVYMVENVITYNFPSVRMCKKAERECKQELECGIVLKRDMPDGWTETTHLYNLSKILEIYCRNGGVEIENSYESKQFEVDGL